MLPEQIQGIYKQYKEDLDSIASWLASTAKACGYPAADLQSKSWDVPNAKSTRLKGKDRKQARAAGLKPGVLKGSKLVIAINDFVPLARFIAKSNRSIAWVPDAFTNTIDRLIIVRFGFGSIFSNQQIDPDPAPDRPLGFFLAILTSVRKIMRPRMLNPPASEFPDPQTLDEDDSEEEDPMQRLWKGMARCVVGDAVDNLIKYCHNASIERPETQKDDDTVYEAEIITCIEESLFAYLVIVYDLQPIRTRIMGIWSHYKEGMFDLTAAAVATNTAISLARGLIDDVLPMVDNFKGGVAKMAQNLFLLYCLDNGYTLDEVHDFASKGYTNGIYKYASNSFLVTAMLMEGALEMIDDKGIPLFIEGTHGFYHARNDWETKSGPKKVQEDKVLIMEFLTEVMAVIRYLPDYPVEDEVIRGFRELDGKRAVPLPLVFAIQIYLDIHHTLGVQVGHPLKVVMHEAKLMDFNITKILEFHRNGQIERMDPGLEKAFEVVHKLLRWMKDDPVYYKKACLYKQHGFEVPDEMRPHRILRRSPVLSGMYLFYLRRVMCGAGVQIANQFGAVMSCVHLYSVLVRERNLSRHWIDMEIAATLLGNSAFWVDGKPPSSTEDAFRKFSQQMGVPITSFTKKRKGKTKIGTRSGLRSINVGCVVSEMISVESIRGREHIQWTGELIRRMIAKTDFAYALSPEKVHTTLIDLMSAEVRAEFRVVQENTHAQKIAAPEQMHVLPNSISISDLTTQLGLGLGSEALELALPYTFLHRCAWKMLINVKNHCDQILKKRYSPTYLDKLVELPHVVGYVLQTAIDFHGEADPAVLDLAEEAFNEMLKGGTGVIGAEMAKSCGFNIEVNGKHAAEYVEEVVDEDDVY